MSPTPGGGLAWHPGNQLRKASPLEAKCLLQDSIKSCSKIVGYIPEPSFVRPRPWKLPVYYRTVFNLVVKYCRIAP